RAADPGAIQLAVSGRQIRYVDWLFPGILAMNMMFSCLFGVGYVVLRYRQSGFLKRLHATPLTAFEFLSAQVLSRLAIILMITAVLYTVVGAMLHFHDAGNLALLLLIAVLGALAMIALGLTVAARLASEELVNGLLNLLTWPMVMLSGAWFSLAGAPGWLRWIAAALPLTQLLHAARAVMLVRGGPGHDRAESHLSGGDDAGVSGHRRRLIQVANLADEALMANPPMRFMSDNTATACPEMLAALAEANRGLAIAYGDDPWTERLDRALGEFFDKPVRAFALATGTAANALALATLTPPYGAIFAHREAHIACDECGAPAFYSGGAQLQLLEGKHAKLAPDTLAAALDAHPTSVHTVQPAAVSVSQASELGAAYRPDELAALCAVAHARGLKVHMDGARFAN
ncbi:membrane protein containing Aromatic amino acid beta-eliminating lyase/threonine aldolase, partial [mine drainage metagenome]